jgi:hypothetical protein
VTFALVGTPTNPGLQGTSQGASSTFNLTTTPTAGNLIVMPMTVFCNGLSQGVTVGGQAMTRISTAVYDAANLNATELWYILSFSGSGNSVTITYNNAGGGGGFGNFPLCSVAEFSSAGGVAVDLAPTTTTASSTAPTITSNPTSTAQASELAIAMVTNLTGDTTITGPAGYTSLTNDGNWSTDASGQSGYQILSAAGVQSATWGFAPSQTYRALLATFMDPGSGGGGAVIVPVDPGQTMFFGGSF